MQKETWRCRLGLSVQVIVPIVLVLLLILGVQFYETKSRLKDEKKMFLERFRETEYTLQEDAASLARENLKLALAIAAIPGVQESLVFEDRERLLGLIKPILEELKKASPYPLKIHFHKPPGISFLRVWKPDKYGDDLTGFRKTVVEVLRTGRPIYGIEPGRAGLAVRGIAPVFWEGSSEPVGSVEVFTSLKAVAERLRNIAGEHNALFWIETVKATVVDHAEENHLGRFKILLPPRNERELELISEELLEKATHGALVEEKDNYLINAIPIKDYKGEVVGVYVRFVDLSGLLSELRADAIRTALELGILFVIAMAITVLVIRVSLVKPLKRALASAERVARGELDQGVFEGGSCELRDLSKSLNRVIHAVGSYVMAIQKGVRNLEEVSSKMEAEAERLASGSDQVRNQSEKVLELSETAAHEINQIAQAVDQFTVAIQEIINHINETSQGVERVKDRVVFATEKIKTLAESSKRIGEVVRVIEEIAGQTNLLALNATIEAARAGEAGKGFAVVANEVKELAKQTTEATEDIRKTVEGIQKEVDSTVQAINEVGEIVSGVSDLATQVAGAAEEQSAVVNDIKESVERGAESVRRVVEEVRGTASVLEEFLSIADRMKDLQKALSELAEEMRRLSARFSVRGEVVEQLEKVLKK